ncbi:MAG: carbon-nitrogen hydrolase family protein [Oscillospiraceae bacterium]
MKIAAIQLDCDFADVNSNLRKAEKYIRQAYKKNADLVLLPEFFSSAIGFSPKMNDVALQGTFVRGKLKELSSELDIIIGGSYLFFDGNECYNTFDLIFPDETVFSHKKDIPTQFENCYYTMGDINNILHTPIGEIGVALCWEMIRSDTLKRLSGKVDLILAGSCWWDLPVDAPAQREPLRQYNQKLALETPATFAKLLHTPVIHANHCGTITAYNFPDSDKLQTRQLVGATQIIDSDGVVIIRKNFSEGEGIIIEDIPISNKERKIETVDDTRYWIPSLPDSYIKAWENINPIAHAYYKKHTLPYYREHLTK